MPSPKPRPAALTTLSALTAATLILALALLLAACNDDPVAPSPRGTVVIEAEPGAIAAPWHLAGPDGYAHDGSGDATVGDLRAGTYTLAWQELAGYVTPAADTLELAADSTATFAALYEEIGRPFPDTPDKLMANFRVMYEEMDVDLFARLLHPDHVTLLQQSTIADFPDVGPTLDLTEETRIHQRMFSRQDVIDPLGQLVPGIHDVLFWTFSRQGEWAPSPGTDPIPDTECALYNVNIRFDRGQTYSILQVTGGIKFYVTHQDSLVAGTVRPYYRLRGQLDLTDDYKALAIAPASWGTVKALFR